MNKKSLFRHEFRQTRQRLSKGNVENFSKLIVEGLFGVLSSRSSSYVALFAGTKEEPDLITGGGLDFERGQFCFPRIESSGKNMNFYEVKVRWNEPKVKWNLEAGVMFPNEVR